jgi:hypothetical protein
MPSKRYCNFLPTRAWNTNPIKHHCKIGPAFETPKCGRPKIEKETIEIRVDRRLGPIGTRPEKEKYKEVLGEAGMPEENQPTRKTQTIYLFYSLLSRAKKV